jgi:Amt family ammonium transporter
MRLMRTFTWAAVLLLACITSVHAQATATTAPADPAAATAPATSATAGTSAPAATPPAPIAETRPYVTSVDKISAGDTAWMLTSTALVLLMTIPGLALFYAGMVRRQNVLATALQSFAICCTVTVVWVLVGYSIAFTPGSTPFIGGSNRVLLLGMTYMKEAGRISVSHLAPTIPESVYVMFQLTFAIITPALITGAFAERMRFGAMITFMVFWSLLVYAPVAHWVWEPSGWLASMGVLDFAGGTVVHINAGAAGLVCAWVLGPRIGYGRKPFVPFNLALTMAGAALLWVGWFGFNAGSAGAADGRAGMAMLVTQIATAMAAIAWMVSEWLAHSRVTLLGACSGAVAGLVAITPASGFVNVNGALAIGLAAGVCCYWASTALKRRLGADDSLDVFGIHGVGGLVGAVLTGVFAQRAISGVDADLKMQVFGALVTLVYSAVVTFIILKVVDWTIGLRVTPAQEELGLDLALHGEQIA